MRLISLTIRNYRVHRELVVEFDPSRQLIGGPNETGKSTLAEAIHRALFLRAKTTGNLREEMRSSRHPGDPEVILIFEAGGRRWSLEKRFAGTKGSALLSDGSGRVFKDDEADSQLSEILQTESGGRANSNQLAASWAHLWVWQGSSGSDPSRHASDYKDTLVQRLQQEGLAAVMQSAADQRVREKVSAAYDELFTATGKPKAGSKPELARARAEETREALERAEETFRRLEQAAVDHQRAEQEIAEVQATLPGFANQLALTKEKLAEVEKLNRLRETQHHEWTKAVEMHDGLVEKHKQIADLRVRQKEAEDALIPAEQREKSLAEEVERAEAASLTADRSALECAEKVKAARRQHDFIMAAIADFEKAADLERVRARSEEAKEVAGMLSELRVTLSKLPEIGAADLESLRKLDRAVDQAKAALDAMATGVELVASDVEVALDGVPLSSGEARTLTDEGELTIGHHTRIRIRPGGGTSLSEIRIRHHKAMADLTAALERLTLRDLDHATEVLEQRQGLAGRISHLEVQWKALGGQSLQEELAEATAAHDSAKAKVERQMEVCGAELARPASIDEARRELEAVCERLKCAEDAEAAAGSEASRLRQSLGKCQAALEDHRDKTSAARLALRDLGTKIRLLEETHGDTPHREDAIVRAAAAVREAATKMEATDRALGELGPDLLANDRERLIRAIERLEDRSRKAKEDLLIARERLAQDGTSDPQADLAHARARHSAACEAHRTEERRARAIALLHELFTSSREAVDRSIVQPLANRISEYLRCLFGPGTEVEVKVSDGRIEGFDLRRQGDPQFGFATLSGGAKEQVAAAVRLAMAEILATGHDGCLPVVFDDAFAYSDPTRIQALQRMLDLAAARGLQVIVLTCNPTDYSGFGASEFRLGDL